MAINDRGFSGQKTFPLFKGDNIAQLFVVDRICDRGGVWVTQLVTQTGQGFAEQGLVLKVWHIMATLSNITAVDDVETVDLPFVERKK